MALPQSCEALQNTRSDAESPKLPAEEGVRWDCVRRNLGEATVEIEIEIEISDRSSGTESGRPNRVAAALGSLDLR